MADRLNIILDTNSALDSFLQRQPFNKEADRILQAHDSGPVTVYLTASSITDVFYLGDLIRRRDLGYTRANAYKEAIEDVRACLDTLEICNVDLAILRQALALPGKDFEDNVQIACALAYNLDAIVTRDKRFRSNLISVLTPTQLLQRIYP